MIFKADYGSTLRTQRWFGERAAEAGVPASQVIALEDEPDEFPYPYAIFERLEGAPMGEISFDESPPSSPARETGRLLRRLHSVAVEGVGWLQVTGRDARGINKSWYEMMRQQLQWGLIHVLKHELLPMPTMERLWRALLGRRRELDSLRARCLLHGDLRPDHVFVSGERVTGILDFQGRIGDPVMDFSHYAIQSGPRGLSDLLDGYEPDAALREGIERRLELYSLIGLMGLLRWFHERGGPGLAPKVEHLRAELPQRVRAL